jgi:hypothetical protein
MALLDSEKRKEHRRESKKRRRKNFLAYGAALLFATGATYTMISEEKEVKRKNTLYDKISLSADLNLDNVTDVYEWAKVYESLDLRYDVNYSDPKKDLNVDQMKEYLISEEQ